LADLSRPFGTTVVVNGDMAEIKLKSGKQAGRISGPRP
jgi:hypothetical protein